VLFFFFDFIADPFSLALNYHSRIVVSHSKLQPFRIFMNRDSLKMCGWFCAEYWFDFKDDVIWTTLTWFGKRGFLMVLSWIWLNPEMGFFDFAQIIELTDSCS
jgi:hypothetical protein